MISFISWVNNPEKYEAFKESAKNFSCEFIEIGQEAKSLAEAYNRGTERAAGDLLCYVHQDVIIRDSLFDVIVYQALEDPKTGFAGPIGSLAIGNPTWWDTEQYFKKGWVIQKNGEQDYLNSFGAYYGPCRQLDGLMLCTKQRFLFPENLPGIHFLDLWMCREAEAQGFTNRIFSAAIEHDSWGNIAGEDFKKNLEIYKTKWL